MSRRRPHPRAVAAWSAAGLLVALATTSPVYRGVALVCGLVTLVSSVSWARARHFLVAMATASLLAIVFNVLLSHTGGDVMFTIPRWLPGVGGDATVESVVYGIDAALGLAAALVAVAPLALLVDSHDLVNALPGYLDRTGILLATAANLVPRTVRSFAEVREAQQLRGWRPRGPRSWGELLLPVVLTAMEGSIQLAESMDARAYASGARTRFRASHWTRSDVAVLVAAATAAAIFLSAKLTGAVPDWYPYPTPAAPDVDLRVLAGIASLAVPAVAWHGQASAG